MCQLFGYMQPKIGANPGKYGMLKTRQKRIFSRIAGSSNGRTSPSGGEYLGSSPSPAASLR